MINLLYGGNQKAYDGMMISLISIANNTKEPLNVFILTMNLSDVESRNQPISNIRAEYLEEILKRKNIESKVTLLDITDLFRQEMGHSKNIKSFYTPYTFLRLFADTLPLPDKVLYLDTDTMANGDIAPLFNKDITGYEFAGVKDNLGRFFISPNYMNAGVLLFNLAEVRKTGLFKKAREMCNNKKMAFPDQTALNKLNKKKYFLPRCYNEQYKIRKDTVIQHFSKSIRFFPFYHTVNIKPWQVDKIHDVYHLNAYDGVLYEYLAHVANLRLKGIY